jgi:small conductance mechanosensitive channel
VIGKGMTKANVDETLANFVQDLCYVVLLVFVVIASLDKLGVRTTSFAVVIGAAGLAIGFALQGSLANFAAGVMLIIFKPFKVGDFVEAAGKMGTVKEIQIFNTILNSPDNVQVIIPNAQVTGSNIMNYTVNGTRRVDLVVGVSYEDDLKKAQQVIEGVLAGDDRILKEPAATVAVSELGDSSVNFVVRPWVKAADYWDVYFDITEKVKLALDKKGISIPYPQRDIHMKSGVS